MSGITATAKAAIYIGSTAYPTGQTTAPALADYTSEASWTQIREITTIGDFGDSADEIKVNTIDDARVYKLKGPRDAGDLALECAFVDGDPGQQALLTAMVADANYSFKIVLNNPGATGKGTTTYFRGLVLSAQTKMGAANTAVMLSVKVAINSVPLAVAAS